MKEPIAIVPHSKRIGRELAMQFLYACEIRAEMPDAEKFSTFIQVAIDAFDLDDNRMIRRANKYAEKLYSVVEENRDEIDRILSARCLKWSFERLSGIDRNLLRIATAEIIYMDAIPAVVAIDEAVNISRDYSGGESCNYLNGILNAIKNDFPRKGVK